MLRGQARNKLEGIKKRFEEEASTSGTDEKVVKEAEKKLLDEMRNDLKGTVDRKRWALSGSVNRAEYDKNTKSISVTKFAGKLIKNMGRSMNGARLLYPEEALFLMEAAALELFHKDVPLSLDQAYSLLLGTESLSWNRYAVYCHLTRAGYTVVRHRTVDVSGEEVSIETPSSQNTSSQQRSIVYDVHLSDSNYSMAKNQKPDHRLLIMGPDDSLNVDDLITLQSEMADCVPFHVGVADQGDVACFSVSWVLTPDLNLRQETPV